MRISKGLAVVMLAMALGACSRSTNTLDVSPPLPPAEEPPDDVPGVYADAGAAQP